MLVKTLRNTSSVVKSQAMAMGTVSLKTFGQPTKVLGHVSGKGNSRDPEAGQVKVAISFNEVVNEDNRYVRGISFQSNVNSGVAGTNGVGKVTAVGSNVSGVSVGDDVVVVNNGTWTDNVTVNASSVAKVGSSTEESSTIPTLLSAWAMLNKANVKNGQTVVHTEGKTAIGQAIGQVGSALGLKVVTATLEEIASADFNNKVGSVGAAITSHSGKPLRDLLKSVSKDGTVVTFNGSVTPVMCSTGVEIPVYTAIFDNKSVSGFDLGAWASNNQDKFREGSQFVSSLIKDKKVSLKANVLPQSDYLKALTSVQESGAAVVLKL